MNYTIEEYVFNDFNASSKARKDVSYFILQNGFVSIGKNDKTRIKNNKTAKILLAIRLYLKLLLSLSKHDTLFLQQSFAILKPILFIKRIKRFRVVYLIHDLFSLRYSSDTSVRQHHDEIRADMLTLSRCDYVIAHNSIMVDKLRRFGCKSHLLSLDIFDYYTDAAVRTRKHEEGEQWKVSFAGYLPKSKFLHTIDTTTHSYDMIIYGAPTEAFESSTYKGSVEPDILPSVIEGHFGLIWEGGYHLTPEDNYTRINNPHKMSMYIVAGLPIICWDKSAAARFVEANELGFSISSLDDIDERLHNISSSDYNRMVANCLAMRNSLVRGEHIKNVIQKVSTNEQ